MPEPERRASPILNALRWLAVLPCWAGASWLGWFIIAYGNRVTMYFAGFDPDSMLGTVYIEIMSHCALGVAGVYGGARVAPYRKSETAMALAVLTILVTGFLLFPAAVTNDWWAIVGGIAVAAGAGVLAWSVATGETEVA